MRMRYIRWHSMGSTANSSNHIVELEAFEKGTDTNVALGKTVTSNVPGATNLSLVTDGNSATNPYCSFGNTQSGVDCYVQVDLGTIYDIDSVVVYPYWGDVRTYHCTKLYTSVDGINWVAPYDSVIHGELSNGVQQVITSWTTSRATTTSWTTSQSTTTSWTTSQSTTTNWTTNSLTTTSWLTSWTSYWTTSWSSSYERPDGVYDTTTSQGTSAPKSRTTSVDTTTSRNTSRSTTTSWTTSQLTTTSWTTSQSMTTSWTTSATTSVDSNGIVIDCSSSIAIGIHDFPLYDAIYTQIPRIKIGSKYLQLTNDSNLCTVRPRVKADISGTPHYIQQLPSAFVGWTTSWTTSQATTTSWTTSQSTTTSWTTSQSTTTSWTTSQSTTTSWTTSYTTTWSTGKDTLEGTPDNRYYGWTSWNTSRSTSRTTSRSTTTSWAASRTTTTSWATSQLTTTSWTTSQSTTTSWTTEKYTFTVATQGGWI